MKIAVIGSGYVGLVGGTCFADFGNQVTCVDIDEKKIALLNSGGVPIYEPGLDDMLERNRKEGRIVFTTDFAAAIKDNDVIFIAVGTPPGKNHEADLSFVLDVAKKIGSNMQNYKVIVTKSTVPVGTADKIEQAIKVAQTTPVEFDVVSNPEFLREGEAILDFTNPERVVIGTKTERARKVMEQLYRTVARANKPIVYTDIKSAEMIKYASNAMLATRISFMNEIARLCEKVGADVKEVAKGMGLDSRIGPRFLQAGLGYGGSCFPKDVQALAQTMQQHHVPSKILHAVEEVNAEQKQVAFEKLRQAVGDVKGKTIAVWGLAFKPKTDDMREAPSLTVIESLHKAGAKIFAFDPEAQVVAKKMLAHIPITYCQRPYDAITGADALVVVTEWNEFRQLDLDRIKSVMKSPIIVDGRNIWEPSEMKAKGFTYIGIGRNGPKGDQN